MLCQMNTEKNIEKNSAETTEKNSEKILDVHCHLLEFGDSTKGFLREDFRNSIKARTYLRTAGIIDVPTWLGAKKIKDYDFLNESFQESLLSKIEHSSLSHAVVLALDGVYDDKGVFDKRKTAFYVPNESVMQLNKKSNKTLFGASINPLRRDWEDELDKCIEKNPALIKWLPNVMGFDPADKKIIKFYEKIAETQIPLLTHVGFEYAAPRINDTYTDLSHITLPLEMGVKVIAAHCCGGRPFIDSEKMFQDVVLMTEKYPNMYLDVAATGSIHRRARLSKSLRNEKTNERLLYGTDFPIPVHPWAFPELENEYFRTSKNYFDCDIAIKRAMGLSCEEFSRGYKIINPKSFNI